MILFAAFVGLIIVVQLTTSARREATAAQAEINQLKQREHALLDAAKEVRQSYTSDQQQALPSAHELVDRKAFLWTRLLADLESSLPPNVKVSRIAVQNVSRQSDQTVAQLDLAVFAKDAATINDMISSMHKEGIFEAEIRNQNLQKGRGEPGTEYELFVIYRAPSSYTSEHVAEVDKAGKGGDVPR